MLTRIAALVAPVCFLFFTACSGGGNTKPPKTEKDMTAVDLKMLDNLYDHAQKAKQVCSQDMTPVAVDYAILVAQAQQQICLGAPIPGISGGAPVDGAPGAAIPNGFGGFDAFSVAVVPAPDQPACGGQLPILPAPQPKPVSQGCKDAMMNFVMTFNTIKLSNGTLYANNPEAQAWFQAQFVDLINMVGGNVMAQAPGLPVTNPYFLGEMARFGVSMGQGLAAQTPQLAGLASSAPSLMQANLPPQVMQYLQMANGY